METEADKLRREIKHFRALLGGTDDPRTREVITKMLTDAEARLKALTKANNG